MVLSLLGAKVRGNESSIIPGDAAKRYITGECRCESEASTSVSADAGVYRPVMKRFEYLATKLSAMAPDQESVSGIRVSGQPEGFCTTC